MVSSPANQTFHECRVIDTRSRHPSPGFDTGLIDQKGVHCSLFQPFVLMEKCGGSTMGLNIKNAEVEQLAAEAAHLAPETKTEAIRRALLERRTRLRANGPERPASQAILQYFENEVWPFMPQNQPGRVLTRTDEDEILGFCPDGV